MNYCHNCGQRLEQQWKVCPECGQSIIPQTYQTQQTPQPQQPIKQTIPNQEEYTWFDNYGFGTLSLFMLIPFALFLFLSFPATNIVM